MIRRWNIESRTQRLEFELKTVSKEVHSFCYDHPEMLEKAERAFRASFLESLAKFEEQGK